MSDTHQKLKEMAQLSVLANRISETQAKNLTHFPFVFFEGVQAANIDYDLGHAVDEKSKEVHHRSYVAYHLVVAPLARNENLDKRFLALEVAVRKLFWNDVRVEVYWNSEKKFESKK